MGKHRLYWMDTTKLAVICCMFLIEVESCFQFRVRGTIKLISLVTSAMLLQDRDAGIITRIVFYQPLWVYEVKKAHMYGIATYLP